MTSINSFRRGVHPYTSILFYKTIIRPRLEWSFPLFHNIKANLVYKIQVTQNNALRKSLGCMCTTPMNVLHHLAAVPTLKIRREFLANRYETKALSISKHQVIYHQNNLTKSDCRAIKNRFSINSTRDSFSVFNTLFCDVFRFCSWFRQWEGI